MLPMAPPMSAGELFMQQKKQGGFTYLTILFSITVAGIVLSTIGIDWSQTSQREKERELLFVGNQFREAIALYYQRTPGPVKRYPERLEDLLTDTRYNPQQHYLRRLYPDPLTNQKKWGLVMAPEGGIMGVYSVSDLSPIKITNFSYENLTFEGATKYSSWKFLYTPMQKAQN